MLTERNVVDYYGMKSQEDITVEDLRTVSSILRVKVKEDRESKETQEIWELYYTMLEIAKKSADIDYIGLSREEEEFKDIKDWLYYKGFVRETDKESINYNRSVMRGHYVKVMVHEKDLRSWYDLLELNKRYLEVVGKEMLIKHKDSFEPLKLPSVSHKGVKYYELGDIIYGIRELFEDDYLDVDEKRVGNYYMRENILIELGLAILGM